MGEAQPTRRGVDRTNALYLGHLLACGLHGVPAEPLPSGASWEAVDRLAKFNGVQNLAHFGARSLANVPDPVRKAWSGAAKGVLFKHASFDLEREAVLGELFARGIACMPLKGVHVRGYYPRPEMRSFADNDILYGFVEPDPDAPGSFRVQGATPAQQQVAINRAVDACVAVMEARGYQTAASHRGNHETFYKKPFYNFELHRRLMSPSSDLYAYYQNPWQRAVPDPANPLLFTLSPEDEYVYLVAHAFKHFDHSGCGVRTVADEWVVLERRGPALDWAYVERELAAADPALAAFERSLRDLAPAAFGREGLASPNYLAALTPQQEDLLLYMMGAGTYGTVSVSVERRLDKLAEQGGGAGSGLRAYIKERIFLPEDTLRDWYPTFYKYKPLRILLPPYRAVKGLLVNRKKLAAELRALRNRNR